MRIKEFRELFEKSEKATTFCEVRAVVWDSFYRNTTYTKRLALCNEFLEKEPTDYRDFKVGIFILFNLVDQKKLLLNHEKQKELHRDIRIRFLDFLMFEKKYIYFSDIKIRAKE